MDEYTALQKYILFYRDARTNPHAEKAVKKKAWWQFWKSGSATAAAPIEDSGAVPDERKFFHLPQLQCMMQLHLHYITLGQLFANAAFVVVVAGLHAFGGLMRSCPSSSSPSPIRACAAAAVEPIRGDPHRLHHGPHRTIARCAACEMSITILLNNFTDFNRSHQHPASHRSHHQRRRHSSQALWLQRDLV
jgi:hypothetical protein